MKIYGYAYEQMITIVHTLVTTTIKIGFLSQLCTKELIEYIDCYIYFNVLNDASED